jgi:hypothetical protein
VIVLETLVSHGSDFIEWIEGSGRSDAASRSIAADGLGVVLTSAPKDLTLLHRRGSTVLLRRLPATLHQTLDGRPPDALLLPPTVTPYTVAGDIADSRGVYQPRRFSLQFGSTVGKKLKLYRSSAGTSYGQAGGIFGTLRYAPTRPAAWARVQLTVTTPLGKTIEFVAQADANGEFALAFDRLPLPTLDTAATYQSRLKVFALNNVVDGKVPPPLNIDELPAARVATGKDGQQRSRFAAELPFRITPGVIRRIISPDHAELLLAPGNP